MLDAASTLEGIRAGDMPDGARFRTAVARGIEQARAGNDAAVGRVYGEMVDVLWRARRYDAALRVEELWNELAQEYAFSLLCGYAMTNFAAVTGAQRFADVCRHHTHVLPPDRNSVAEEEARRLVDGVLREWATTNQPRKPHADVENAAVEYATEHFALAPLVSETLETLAPLLVANHLTCDVTGESAMMPIAARADRERTHQIIVTLLTNAIKFTPPGGRLAVELSTGAIEPDTVRIRVTDTGVGIPSPRLDHIFEPFGLGLTISRDLARRMGGDLTVSSALGVGATFSLTLPAAAETPPRPLRP